jgi:hypothetical protein
MTTTLLCTATLIGALTLPLCTLASPSASTLGSAANLPDASGLYAGLPDPPVAPAAAALTLAGAATLAVQGLDPTITRGRVFASAASADLDGRRTIAALPSVPSFGFGQGADFDLTIWNFIATVKAQQQVKPFAVLQSQTTTLKLAVPAAVAPVPLPGAAWLFVVGLLGLLGASLGLGGSARAVLAAAKTGPNRPLAAM